MFRGSRGNRQEASRAPEFRVDLLDPADAEWPRNDEEAADRANRYVNHDPFPDLPPALLGAGAIIDYSRITGMIYPFIGVNKETNNPDPKLLKPASYEVRPGDSFIYYDLHGYRRTQSIDSFAATRFITLQANSITFCSIDEHIRVPNYIAWRFNLRIKHVHRGLLLGTGPLVDPGYHKKILIPLHNLTDRAYDISLDEGLIWVEFTKTYRKPGGAAPMSGKDVELNPDTQKDFNKFLMATGGGPIRSSIPTAVRQAEDKAEIAMQKVDRLERNIRTISIAGIIAIILALFSIVLPILDLIESVAEKL